MLRGLSAAGFIAGRGVPGCGSPLLRDRKAAAVIYPPLLPNPIKWRSSGPGRRGAGAGRGRREGRGQGGRTNGPSEGGGFAFIYSRGPLFICFIFYGGLASSPVPLAHRAGTAGLRPAGLGRPAACGPPRASRPRVDAAPRGEAGGGALEGAAPSSPSAASRCLLHLASSCRPHVRLLRVGPRTGGRRALGHVSPCLLTSRFSHAHQRGRKSGKGVRASRNSRGVWLLAHWASFHLRPMASPGRQEARGPVTLFLPCYVLDTEPQSLLEAPSHFEEAGSESALKSTPPATSRGGFPAPFVVPRVERQVACSVVALRRRPGRGRCGARAAPRARVRAVRAVAARARAEPSLALAAPPPLSVFSTLGAGKASRPRVLLVPRRRAQQSPCEDARPRRPGWLPPGSSRPPAAPRRERPLARGGDL